MLRNCRSLIAGAVAVVLTAPIAGAQVTGATIFSPPAGSILTPLLTRADAPPAGSMLTDPSLANAYDSFAPANANNPAINLNGIGLFQESVTGGTQYCTAERIGPRSMITAAHCVTNDLTGAPNAGNASAFVAFNAPGSTDAASARQNIAIQSIVVNPDYHGFNNPGTFVYTDVAVLNFASDLPSYVTTYDLYTPLVGGEETTNVGFGTYGGGSGATGFDGRRRQGTNTFDGYGGNDPTDRFKYELYTDFDSANPDPTTPFHYDVFCLYGIACGSTGDTEAGIAGGDSGGPLFVGGGIAGIASFGTYFCNDTRDTSDNCRASGIYGSDPVNRPTTDFGSVNGYAPIFANYDFIIGAEASDMTATPEPATVTLLATGFLAVVGVARKRRRSAM